MANETKSRLDSVSEQIRQLRDELEVQLHLGAAEARDEWDKLEPKLEAFRQTCADVADAAEGAAEGVMEAASLAGEELVKGYERIKSVLGK